MSESDSIAFGIALPQVFYPGSVDGPGGFVCNSGRSSGVREPLGSGTDNRRGRLPGTGGRFLWNGLAFSSLAASHAGENLMKLVLEGMSLQG